jgi:16S rRNA (cytosine967-C5)-methyltransferase
LLAGGAGSVDTTLETVGIHALVQNTASQAVAQWAGFLATQDGPRVLDLCAAPGGKSAVLAAQGFQVVSGDIHVDKLHLAQRQWKRLTVQPRAVALDGRFPPFAEGAFDVVVLDAPCSGTGLLNRRPDIKLKTRPEDLSRLNPLQAALLDSAARLVRPGGSLLYSVCSVTTAEGPAQVRSFLQRTPGFTLVSCPLDVPQDALEDGMLALWPQRHGTDGFFAAHLRRA